MAIADTEKTSPKTDNTSSSNKNDRKTDASHANKRGQKREHQRGKRRDDRGGSRNKPEFDHTVLDIRRVSRVVKGGRRFSFRVTLAAGDRKGRVGVGIGKAADTPLAIEKAFRDAKQRMFTVYTTDTMSIPCDIKAKYGASRVLMKPSPGKGIIAGSSVRPVIELAGLNDISTKLLSRSKNSLNNARVAIVALKELSSIYSGKEEKPAGQPHKQEKK